MLLIAGYKINDQLHSSHNSLIYRAKRLADNRPVILKYLKANYPTLEQLSRYQQEYKIIKSIKSNHIIKAYSLEIEQYKPIICLEDFGGTALQTVIKEQNFNLIEILNLFIKISTALADIHRQGVIHKDINPSNIVINLETGVLKIIDFGIASYLSQEQARWQSFDVLEGTLAYISPEQTGRMNRVIDYRTDYYSLGITFYQLLTKRLPFESADILTLLHQHLAKIPPPPHQLNADIPQTISNIVLKLMSKAAEDRYQSIVGLQADLTNCLTQLKNQGHITPFLLGQQDFSDRFEIPQKLYGREEDLEVLLDTFERATQGNSEVLLISGYSGIGKSVLVQETYKRITAKHGYFITGKYEQFQKDNPYSALVRALSDLIQQLLTESKIRLKRWKEKLKQALGINAQLIIEIIPDLKLIIGSQPAPPQLPPAEAQTRFNLTFQQFIRVFARPKHPLVLFLDDLQWADRASLNLLKQLIKNKNTYFFLVGAYRDNEVDLGHPLRLTLNNLEKEGFQIKQITVNPLTFSNIKQLLIDAFYCTIETATPLAELLLQKTGGNPFFVKAFLKSLYTEKLLYFNHQTQQWQWNISQIEMRDITDNVVNLMTYNLAQFQAATRQVLQLAACIGNTFNLKTLSTIHQKSASKTMADLWPAVVDGIIFPLDNAYKLIDATAQYNKILAESNPKQKISPLVVRYKFVHDRVQQAARNLITQATREKIHWDIGKYLLNNKQNNKIFDIVKHLNVAKNLVKKPTEKIELARLNLQAGQKASAAAAYSSALNYFSIALKLLNENSWQSDYNLTLALYNGAAQAAYVTGDTNAVNNLTETIFKQATSILDKLTAYEIKILLSIVTKAESSTATEQIVLSVLEQLGFHFPAQPTTFNVLLAFLKTNAILITSYLKYNIHQKQSQPHLENIAYLANLPPMTDPYKLGSIRIMYYASVAMYICNPNMFLLIVLKAVEWSARYGNSPESPVFYAGYGLILAGVLGRIKSGFQFGQLALYLVEHLKIKQFRASVLVIVCGLMWHWQRNARESLAHLLEAYQSGLEVGNLLYSANSLHLHSTYSLLIGCNLAKLEQEINSYSKLIDRLKQEDFLLYYYILWQTVLNLLGDSANPTLLTGSKVDSKALLPHFTKTNNIAWLARYYIYQTILYYVFEMYPQALNSAIDAEKNEKGVLGDMLFTTLHFYRALIELALSPIIAKGETNRSEQSEQKRILKKVNAIYKKMKKWASHAPVNYLHKLFLIDAERARVLGHYQQARSCYEEAIILAQEHKYIHEEAIARELLGKFFLSYHKTELAHYYLRTAHYAYQQWGAIAKIKHLEARYPIILNSISQTQLSPFLTTTSVKTQQSTTLDYMSVIKSSQTISSQIELSHLLKTLLKLIIENAGAERCVLLLAQKETLFIEGEGSVDADEFVVLQSYPLNENSKLSYEVVQYVARARKNVVLNDATQNENFGRTAYIQQNKPKSILCTPLVNQGQLLGVIYLENNLTTNAFPSERVEVVNLLGTQAAISITNTQAIVARTERERLQIENEFLEKQALELKKLNADKDKFFSIVSHDLRSPFTMLLGYSKQLLQELKTLPPHQLILVEHIYQSAQTTYKLLENLLKWSRLQRGRMAFTLQSTKLAKLVDNTITVLKDVALKKQIQLFHTVDSALWVMIDYNMIDFVIRNLTSNALKFTPIGGQVHITAKLQQTSTVDGETDWVEVAVIDTGVGISQKDSEKLFKIDIHHTTSGTEQEQGTGLGLIMCQEMIGKHGGKIWVESNLGEGTTVKFTIPLDKVITANTNLNSSDVTLSTKVALEGTQDDAVKMKQQEEALFPPPVEYLERLLDLAMQGDLLNIEKQVIELATLDEKFIPFADKLRQLVFEFDDKAILELLEKYLGIDDAYESINPKFEVE